jgi:LPS sulfotransferase NodH
MHSLFTEQSELKLVDLLENNKHRITLLTSAAFLSKLHYVERERSAEKPYSFRVQLISGYGAIFGNLTKAHEEGSDHTYVVADSEDEPSRLEAFREQYPRLNFRGLGADVFPALVARAHDRVFKPIPTTLQAHTATLVFATPRSGSSLLADIVQDVGGGQRVIEHLRKDVLNVLSSGYVFDLKTALRNFINFSTVDGYFGTKLITAFLSQYLTNQRTLESVAEVVRDVRVRAIFLDREDRVAQTISGYLASRRGLWHVTSEAEQQRLQSAAKQRLDFGTAVARYFEYENESGALNALKHLYPGALELSYEKDIIDPDLPALAARVARYIGVEAPPGALKTSESRQRIANDENDRLADAFTKRFREVFGIEPVGPSGASNTATAAEARDKFAEAARTGRVAAATAARRAYRAARKTDTVQQLAAGPAGKAVRAAKKARARRSGK